MVGGEALTRDSQRKEPLIPMETAATHYYMPHYKAGASVRWGQRDETISHVVVRRYALAVYLVGHDAPVMPESLQLAPTAFRLTRAPEAG